nr:hypothetical protein [Tanacetum cinerariifolium]
MTRSVKDQGGLSQMFNDDFHTCMFACFLSQEEPKRLHQALKDPSWIKTMQEELLQFKMQKVWVLVDLPHGKRAIGTKWVFRNKKDKRGIVIRNKARLSAFLYGTIKEEVYVCQPLGFEDPTHPDKVYKVVKALYALHQALRAWYETLTNYLLENGFQRGKIDQTLFIKRQKEGKSASTPIDTEKPFLKDPDVKRIFRYLKGKPHLGLWYPKDLLFDLVAYSDSDYAGASLDRKSTTGGCQFLGCRLIYCQCKKQTVVATSSTEAEYVAAASCYAQVLWIQNQLLDYGNSPLLGVNTPRSDEDRLEIMELTIFLLPKVKKDRIGVNDVDLQVFAVKHNLLLFSLTNWCCSLSAVSSIKYALTVNPNIYVSCIKQFWTNVAIKQVNDVTRLQALVDKKKVVVTEATIREALHLDDEKGVDCLPNEEIFAELARMGYEKPSTKLTFYKAFFSSQWKCLIHTILLCMSAKRTSWNELSSSMASDVICLSSGDLSTHTTKYTSPALTQQVFANMRRVGDVDEHVEDVNSGDAAEGYVSAAHGEVLTIAKEPSIPSPTPPTSPPQQTHDIPSTSQVQLTPPQSPQAQPPSPQPQPQPQQDVGFPMNLLREVMDTCAALTRRVEHLEFDKFAQALEITKLKRRVKKLERRIKGRMIAEVDVDADVVLEDVKEAADEAKEEDQTEQAEVQEVVDVVTTAKLIIEVVTIASETVTAASAIITTAEAQVPATTTTITLTAAPTRVTVTPSRRRKGVVIMDFQEESTTSIIIAAETKTNDKAIDHVKKKAKEDPIVKKYQVLKRKPQTEGQARKNMIVYLKNVIGFKMDYFKGMSYDDIRPIFEVMFNSNMDFLLKTKEQIEEDKNRALQKLNETLAERTAKR